MDREARRYMFTALRGYRGRYTLMLLCRAFLAVSVVALALLTQRLVDGAVALSLRDILVYGGVILLMVLLRTAVGTLASGLESSIHKRMNLSRRQALLYRLISCDTAASEKYHSGLLIERIYQDMDAVSSGVIDIPVQILTGVLRLVSAVGALLALDWRLTVLLGTAGLALFGGVRLFRGPLQRRYTAMRSANEQSHAYYQEAIEHRTIIKAFRAERNAVERAKAGEEKFYRAWAGWRNIRLVSGAALGLFFQLGYFAALILCSYKVFQQTLSFGMMTAVLQLVDQIQEPFASLSGILPMYYATLASSKRLLTLEHLSPELELEPPVSDEAVRAFYRDLRCIRASGLGFRYQRERVLEPSSFELPKGRFTLITGRSGAGKSTLFKLLLGLYPATEGALTLETGTQSRTISSAWRGMFAYVPQGNLLLSGTLRENLALLCGNRTDAELREALEISCAAEFVDALPNGLDTRLGEGGLGLSEGQAQRLSIARGLLSRAPILLLDEATSALDVPTEKRLLQNLHALGDRTVLFISHKSEAYGVCDDELRIENGVATCAPVKGAPR